LDGDALYVDRDGDGDLTDPDEQVLATRPKDTADLKRAGLNERVFQTRLTAEQDGQDDGFDLELLTYSFSIHSPEDKTHTERTFRNITVRQITVRSGASMSEQEA